MGCGERWGTRAGWKRTAGPCSEALLRAVAELLALLEARPVSNAEAVKFLFILPFLPPQKTPHLHSLYLIFFFFINPQLLKLHALGALLWDVKNEKS